MKPPLKIAIYTGLIPNTTFIETLIAGVAKNHEVLLFGTVKKKTHYFSKRITIIDTPTSLSKNIPLTLWRTLKLGVQHPKRLSLAIKEAKTYPTLYTKWLRFSRFVPVLLYAPDIFHLQWTSRIDRWLFLKSAYPCHIVVSLLGSQAAILPYIDPEVFKRYQRCLPKVDAIHSVSEHLGRQAANFNVSPERVHVISTPIPTAAFSYYKPFQKRDVKPFQLVSVGRHHWVKGYRYGIQAVHQLIQSGIAVNYTIIAAGKVTEDLLFQVNQLGLQDYITFNPGLPQMALFEHLQTYDALLLPSLSEGIANVVLEAMAIGLPTISTNCGGMAEVVIPEKTGWLVPVRDAKALADAVVDCMQIDVEDKRKITQEAYDLMNANYHERHSIARMLRLYDEVVGSDVEVDKV
ncbi:colanic acid/amylovoran biosynthesis glycosyltransferase [Winogradskyella pacifica]|uniref:Colanic acid/amylovoran biosynthesis glycosyltransferase n=1 Tax=Winogradskyella pacifica TaxID=664642 RepID=A0A3D9N130_9FLAO|nr:glycosyltransferase [Winogradskyella pacifica]REE24460.1 colanic acid/amylovoran biosynthesis glycosyltransferase [Winogradskyella pacifica]